MIPINQISKSIKICLALKPKHFFFNNFFNQLSTFAVYVKVLFIVLFLFMFCQSNAQTSTFKTEMFYAVDIDEVLKIIANNNSQSNIHISGIESDKKGAFIKVSVYEMEKYESLPDDRKSEAFLYGITNNPNTELATTFQNYPFSLTPRSRWDCFWNSNCKNSFADMNGTLLYPSFDLRLYKKGLYAVKNHNNSFNFSNYIGDDLGLANSRLDVFSGYCNV
ncbi:MAG TPA: hypothetical protein DDZ41_09265, partial [Flavobacterium sp.]|nr:hypothetical protein [Flavobacterium sp.]